MIIAQKLWVSVSLYKCAYVNQENIMFKNNNNVTIKFKNTFKYEYMKIY